MPSTIIQNRIDKTVKTKAEKILKQLGIKPSQAISIFYNQIIDKQGLPFSLNISSPIPFEQKDANEENFSDQEMMQCASDIKELRKEKKIEDFFENIQKNQKIYNIFLKKFS